ncbi:hypothetical protein V5O48_004819 [Marasmius crinis-equi]|uniref:Amidohydrolase-related domain-containing protein n=1 Tax=Marasmius crinis-equi TaxID=585013 RepID=A0ABR3FP16_9AGAR
MPQLKELSGACLNYPAIDNHAHPLLKSEFRNKYPFEHLVSEASGDALTEDAPHTLACLRATAQLAPVLGLEKDASWQEVKAKRGATPYLEFCKRFMDPCKIRCLLLDDGLGGVEEFCESLGWHTENFCQTKRIVRVEVEAEKILANLMTKERVGSGSAFDEFKDTLKNLLVEHAKDAFVVGFKSIVCYRTGLDVSPTSEGLDESRFGSCLQNIRKKYEVDGVVRLEIKPLNDLVVQIALDVAGEYDKPVQFHTGLGDSDITLSLSSTAHMQSIIKEYSKTKFVLLHASYPYMRDAGYLTAAYPNVFLDFGEVLAEMIEAGELSEGQAVSIVKNALFHNSNRLYKLGYSEPEI